VIIAVGGGAGPLWFGLGLAVALLFVGSQLLVTLGKHEGQAPWMATAGTRAGNVAILCIYTGVALFFLSGLILGW
jgi:hypothetical protein